MDGDISTISWNHSDDDNHFEMTDYIDEEESGAGRVMSRVQTGRMEKNSMRLMGTKNGRAKRRQRLASRKRIGGTRTILPRRQRWSRSGSRRKKTLNHNLK